MEREGRASAAPEPWIAHSRAAPNSGTSWQSCLGLIRKPAPPRAGSSLRRRQTAEPLRKSPPRTSPAIPLRIRLRKGSASKVAGFYSATRDRVMPPLRGLLLHRRVQLDYVTELTKDKKVNPDTFARMSGHYSERAICEIVWLVASERFYNMTNIGLNIHSDMLCDISRKKQ